MATVLASSIPLRTFRIYMYLNESDLTTQGRFSLLLTPINSNILFSAIDVKIDP